MRGCPRWSLLSHEFNSLDRRRWSSMDKLSMNSDSCGSCGPELKLSLPVAIRKDLLIGSAVLYGKLTQTSIAREFSGKIGSVPGISKKFKHLAAKSQGFLIVVGDRGRRTDDPASPFRLRRASRGQMTDDPASPFRLRRASRGQTMEICKD